MVLPYINMNPPRVYTCSPFWTPIPPPSAYHLSGSSQCTSPKHPVSCIGPGLVIHFLELSCFLNDPADVNNLIFGSSAGSSAFLKINFNIWKLLKQLEHVEYVTISTFSPSISCEVMGPGAMILGFCFVLFSFMPFFSLSSFKLIKRLFISSLLSAVRVVSSVYLRLLMYLPPMLIIHPTWHFLWCA